MRKFPRAPTQTLFTLVIHQECGSGYESGAGTQSDRLWQDSHVFSLITMRCSRLMIQCWQMFRFIAGWWLWSEDKHFCYTDWKSSQVLIAINNKVINIKKCGCLKIIKCESNHCIRPECPTCQQTYIFAQLRATCSHINNKLKKTLRVLTITIKLFTFKHKTIDIRTHGIGKRSNKREELFPFLCFQS